MHLLWNGLAEYVLEREIEILFGVASFPGTDPEPLAEALAYLHHHHLAPADLRVRARPGHFLDMDRMPREAVEPARALQAIPPLIKAYLRLGGFVGEGAYVDLAFNTVDVCVVMDTARMTERYRQFYERNRGARGREGRLERRRAAGAAAADRRPSGCGSACAAVWARRCWRLLFAVFLPLRGLDLAAERVAGRPVSRLGPRVVQAWAALALPTLGLRFVRRGEPMRGRGPSSPTIRAGSTSWRCSGRRRRSWSRRRRCGRGRASG